MNISETPEEFKIYRIVVSSKDEFIVFGDVLKDILDSKNNFIRMNNGTGFNKAFMVSWKIDMQETKDHIKKNIDKIKSLQNAPKKLL